MSTNKSSILIQNTGLFLGGYLLLHLLIRVVFSPTLQVDDAEQVRLAQNLSLGYPIPQPPLYSWLSWGFFKIFSTGLFALSFLKYILIGLTFWLTWLSSHYIFNHPQTRWLATTSFLLMPSFAWHMHQGFTHTILLGFAIAASLHSILLLQNNQKTVNYIYIGFAFAVGILSKYSFILFMFPLITSALITPKFRNLIYRPKIILSIAIIILITGPHAYWLTQHYGEIFPVISQKLQPSYENSIPESLISIWLFFSSATAFVIPWIIVYVLTTGRHIIKGKDANCSSTMKLLNNFYMIILIAVVISSVFLTMPHFKVRWFHPIMMIFPLWWLAHIEGARPLSIQKFHLISIVTITFTIVIVLIRIMQLTIGPEIGHYSRLNRPIIESLKMLPLPSPSTILITDDDFLGAHILSTFTNNSVMINGIQYIKKQNISTAECLLLWDDDDNHSSSRTLMRDFNIGNIHKTVGGKIYTLYYAKLPNNKCQSLLY